MKYVSIFLSCLAIGPLAADMLRNVQYAVPQDWVVGKETADRIYIPNKTPVTAADVQLFSASSANVLIVATDQASLLAILQQQYPKQTIEVSILETAPNDVLFEWSVEKDTPKVCAWSRIISSTTGHVWLTYFSGNPDDIDTQRSIGVALLKQASTVQN